MITVGGGGKNTLFFGFIPPHDANIQNINKVLDQ
jgi:hypothetical protein